jgi:hypothetical protein
VGFSSLIFPCRVPVYSSGCAFLFFWRSLTSVSVLNAHACALIAFP